MNSLIWRKHLFRLGTILKEQSNRIIKQINAVLSSDFALGLFLPASFAIVGKVIFMSHTILFKRLQWFLTACRVSLKLQVRAVPNVVLQFSILCCLYHQYVPLWGLPWYLSIICLNNMYLCSHSAFDFGLQGPAQIPPSESFGGLFTLYSLSPNHITEITSITQSILL